MKLNLRFLAISIALINIVSYNISGQTKDDFMGNWQTLAPDAPEEYQKSTTVITQDSAFMCFDGITYMPSNSMIFKNDTLRFEISGVFFTIEFKSKTELTGTAYWDTGQSALTLTKIEDMKLDSETSQP